MRTDGRRFDQIRPVTIEPEVLRYAEGSARIQMGETIILCTASLEDGTPKWLQGSGAGWISAEYGMLPRSTHTRINREKAMTGGRTQEISRLIGRSLRSVVDLKVLGERQLTVDCDVLQADGGTRTAAITGGFVALAFALRFMHQQGMISRIPITHFVSAISVGLKDGQTLLDLNYDEDSTIHTDMNFVMTNDRRFVEIQGTAEETPFSRPELDQMLAVAEKGCLELVDRQRSLVRDFLNL
ncbi:MAG: ribonuclease PH [Bdellovibrionales bacterium]|nr:ribonuclease PH [Bdellovibrionales bacterium]